MPSELQQNRYDQMIRRVGGIVGPGSKVSEALTELFPTIDVERVPGELLLLGGTMLGFGGSLITAAVAQFPEFQLFNPAKSGKLVTLTTVKVSSSATQVIRMNVENVALGGGIGTEKFRDLRLGVGAPTGQPTANVRTASSVALPGNFASFRISVGAGETLSDDNGLFVLAPGTGVNFGGTGANSTLEFLLFWRERVAEQSELNL